MNKTYLWFTLWFIKYYLNIGEMAIKIGINGLGRIGKLVFRLAFENPNIEVVQINDKMDTKLMAHLLKYDSLHGPFLHQIDYNENHIIVDGKQILVTNQLSPDEIKKNSSGAEIVIDSSGRFKTAQLLEGHIRNGAKKVILSCPPDDDSIKKTVVLGVNDHILTPTDTIISNASCTTNCVAILLKVLCDEFGFVKGFMNTVHPTTNNQNLQDGYHSDPRRARCAICNIIPTTSSAIKTVERVMPNLKNRFDGFATRVPVADCSFVELTAQLSRNVTIDEINSAFSKHANGALKPFLEYTNDPIVSSDITNNPHSAIFDALATKVLMGDMVQILGWYDNEYGYSSRIVDLIQRIG